MSTNTSAIERVNALSFDDPELEAKLQKIAEMVAANKKNKKTISTTDTPVDPADKFACDGCQ